MQNVNYVNSVMLEINELTDSIYEHLMDEDYDALIPTIQNLIMVLRDLHKSHYDETVYGQNSRATQLGNDKG
jgi:hypothetical protein